MYNYTFNIGGVTIKKSSNLKRTCSKKLKFKANMFANMFANKKMCLRKKRRKKSCSNIFFSVRKHLFVREHLFANTFLFANICSGTHFVPEHLFENMFANMFATQKLSANTKMLLEQTKKMFANTKMLLEHLFANKMFANSREQMFAQHFLFANNFFLFANSCSQTKCVPEQFFWREKCFANRKKNCSQTPKCYSNTPKKLFANTCSRTGQI